jgi:hypothetical protein
VEMLVPYLVLLVSALQVEMLLSEMVKVTAMEKAQQSLISRVREHLVHPKRE